MHTVAPPPSPVSHQRAPGTGQSSVHKRLHLHAEKICSDSALTGRSQESLGTRHRNPRDSLQFCLTLLTLNISRKRCRREPQLQELTTSPFPELALSHRYCIFCYLFPAFDSADNGTNTSAVRHLFRDAVQPFLRQQLTPTQTLATPLLFNAGVSARTDPGAFSDSEGTPATRTISAAQTLGTEFIVLQ